MRKYLLTTCVLAVVVSLAFFGCSRKSYDEDDYFADEDTSSSAGSTTPGAGTPGTPGAMGTIPGTSPGMATPTPPASDYGAGMPECYKTQKRVITLFMKAEENYKKMMQDRIEGNPINSALKEQTIGFYREIRDKMPKLIKDFQKLGEDGTVEDLKQREVDSTMHMRDLMDMVTD